MRFLAFAAVLLAAGLAGCAGGGGSDDPAGPEPADVAPVSLTKGAISGVVVDETIRPLQGATVRLMGGGAEATSDAEGLFSFPDVEPGFHAMEVSLPLFIAAQVTAEVVAGETAKVKAQLVRDPTPQPYHVTYQFDGHMQAWGGIAEYEVQEASGEAAPLCECRLLFTPEAKPSTIVFEAFWEENLENPLGAEYYFVVEQTETGARSEDYCSSPCYQRIGGSSFEAGKEAYARLDGPDEWPAVDQRFKIIVTVFYNGEAPSGWTIQGL